MYTEEQRLQLKAFILADPVLSTKISGPGTDYAFISNALNAASSPAFVCWRTNVTQQEVMLNGFNWTRVDNLSVGKSRIWEWLFQFGSIDPSKPNIRAGIDATWTGTQADLDVRAAVYVHCKRTASVAEKVLASGVGSDASPGLFGWEGSIGIAEVGAIIA